VVLIKSLSREIKKMKVKVLLGYVILGVLVLLLFWDKPERAQAFILFFTLLAVLVYVADTNRLAIDTNRLANYQSMQFRGMWIAGLFKDFSTEIDAFIRDIKKGEKLLKLRLDFHISDVNNYFDVLLNLFQKIEDKNYLTEQQKEFHKLWEDMVETYDMEKDIFINFLIDFKKEMQKRIGNMI
jgi:hypothetical protein